MKQLKKLLLPALAVLLLCSLLCGCRGSLTGEPAPEPKLILRYADNQPEGYPTTVAAEYFAALVEERTGGDILIRVYPNGELGGENSVVEQVQFGGIDMCRACMGTMANVDSRLDVLQLPFLYRSSEHMFRVLDHEIGDMFLESIRDEGMLGLSWYDAGARSFYSTVPIRTLEDLKGLRIRIQDSDAIDRMVSLLGAVPIRLDYGDVYSAMVTGKIDAADNNWPSYISAGHYEAAGYFLADEHSRQPEMQVIGLKALEKVEAVDPGYVEVLKECARESAVYERTLWKEREEEAKKLALERGCTVTVPPPAELKKFREAIKPMYEMQSEETKEMIRRIGSS